MRRYNVRQEPAGRFVSSSRSRTLFVIQVKAPLLRLRLHAHQLERASVSRKIPESDCPNKIRPDIGKGTVLRNHRQVSSRPATCTFTSMEHPPAVGDNDRLMQNAPQQNPSRCVPAKFKLHDNTDLISAQNSRSIFMSIQYEAELYYNKIFVIYKIFMYICHCTIATEVKRAL